MTTGTAPKKLTTWNVEKANRYRGMHPGECLVWHLLLDVSPSMYPHRQDVIRSYNMHLRWLQAHTLPMSLGQRILFDDTVQTTPVQSLGAMQPLTAQEYAPDHSDGTAIFEAMGNAIVTQDTPGTHVLVLLTDGEDCCKRTAWTEMRVHELFVTLQSERGWCGVFLGVDQEAIDVGKRLGFPDAHCLLIAGDKIPEAFFQFQQAMQRYLDAPQSARKALAAGGLFHAS